MNAPERLIEDGSIAPKIRDDLRRAQASAVLPFDTALGLSRLKAGIASGGGTIAPPAAGGLFPGAGWKVFAALGVVGGVGLWLLSGETKDEVEMAHAPAGEAALLEDEPEESAALVASEPAPQTPPSVDAALDAKPVVTARPEAKVAAAPEKDATPLPKTDPLADEIAHLGQLRTLFKGDPAAAVASAREGHQKFASGMLYEEREALLILSLRKLGRMDEATQRAEAFRAKFPTSAFLAKIGTGTPATQNPTPASKTPSAP